MDESSWPNKSEKFNSCQLLSTLVLVWPGLYNDPKRKKNNVYGKVGGTNREYYGIFESGSLSTKRFCFAFVFVF